MQLLGREERVAQPVPDGGLHREVVQVVHRPPVHLAGFDEVGPGRAGVCDGVEADGEGLADLAVPTAVHHVSRIAVDAGHALDVDDETVSSISSRVRASSADPKFAALHFPAAQ